MQGSKILQELDKYEVYFDTKSLFQWKITLFKSLDKFDVNLSV